MEIHGAVLAAGTSTTGWVIGYTIGIVVVLVVFTLFKRRVIPVQGSTMEGVAIYWHFVDSVWLLLYPLLYLAGRP